MKFFCKTGKMNSRKFKVVFIILLIVILGLIFFITKNSKEIITFELKDKCGKILNLISHTIETENVCKIRCHNQCKSRDYDIESYEFVKAEIGCHSCKCFCK